MTDSTHVTILSEYYHPEEASTAQLITELATSLTNSRDVDIVTALPNYHETDRSSAPPRHENHQGVDVHRIRGTRFDKDTLPLRIINWISFTVLATLELVVNHRHDDVRLVLSNPPILPLATWLAKRVSGTPYVYVIYDMYPDMPIELGYFESDGIIVGFWHRFMTQIYRDADRIVVLGDSMDRRLRAKMADDPKFDPEKIETIPNWEDPAFIEPMAKADNDFAQSQCCVNTFTLVYSGNIGRFHELETAIDAIAELEARGRDDIQFLVIGDGARKAALQSYVNNKEIENVRFLPFQPLDRVPETLTSGDASLVGIKPQMEGLCVSSKLYSSLAAGLPVLAVVGEHDEVARVVREYECGKWVESGDASHAADILESWADNDELRTRLGENARNCLEQRYTRDQAVKAYSSVLNELC